MWTTEMVAASPEEAARKALEVHRDPESTATVFQVRQPDGRWFQVDLNPEEGDGEAVKPINPPFSRAPKRQIHAPRTESPGATEA